MDNNQIFRRIRYIFDLNDPVLVDIFGLAEYKVTKNQVKNWLKKDIDPEYVSMSDVQFAAFLDGLITYKRGPKEGTTPVPESKLNNNIIFRKLRIALNLKDQEILEILKLSDFQLSKHELSAFFRKPGQSQYRECKDQVLRNFLKGLQCKYRKEGN